MAQHMLVPLDLGWLQSLQHSFLIRDPHDMVASYVHKRGSVTVTGFGRYSEHRLALPKTYRRIVEEYRPHYEFLFERKSG